MLKKAATYRTLPRVDAPQRFGSRLKEQHMEREILAYVIMAVTLAAAVAGIVYARYNSGVETYRRERASEVKAYNALMAERRRAAEESGDAR